MSSLNEILKITARESFHAGRARGEWQGTHHFNADLEFLGAKHGYMTEFRPSMVTTTIPEWYKSQNGQSICNTHLRAIYHLNFEFKEGNYFDQFFSEFSSFGKIEKRKDGKLLCDPPRTLADEFKFYRHAREAHAASCYAALQHAFNEIHPASRENYEEMLFGPRSNESITRRKLSACYEMLDDNVNFLDVGNAGESWLFELADHLFPKNAVKFHTIDINKSKDELCSQNSNIDPERWNEILADARDIKAIQHLLPSEGFKVINVARGCCEIFNKDDFVSTLNDLYDLLCPGGTLVFPVVGSGFHLSPNDATVKYSCELGDFEIGGKNTGVLSVLDYENFLLQHAQAPEDIVSYGMSFAMFNDALFGSLPEDAYPAPHPEYVLRKHSQNCLKRKKLTLEELKFFDRLKASSIDVTGTRNVWGPPSQTSQIRYTFSVTKPVTN